MSRSDFLSSTSASGGTEPLDRLIQHALRHYGPVALPANFASEVASLVIDAERKDRRETLFLLGALIVAVLVMGFVWWKLPPLALLAGIPVALMFQVLALARR